MNSKCVYSAKFLESVYWKTCKSPGKLNLYDSLETLFITFLKTCSIYETSSFGHKCSFLHPSQRILTRVMIKNNKTIYSQLFLQGINLFYGLSRNPSLNLWGKSFWESCRISKHLLIKLTNLFSLLDPLLCSFLCWVGGRGSVKQYVLRLRK